MSDPTILKYINDSRAEGVLDIDIRAALSSSGWDTISIDKAFQDIDIQKKRASVFSPKQESTIANIGQDAFRGGSVASHAPAVTPKDDPNFPKIPEVMPPSIKPKPVSSGGAEAVPPAGGVGVMPQTMPAGGNIVAEHPAQVQEIKPQAPEYRIIGESGLLTNSSRGPLLQSEQASKVPSAGGADVSGGGLGQKNPPAEAWGGAGAPGRGLRSKIIITVISILLLLLAGGAAAGWYYYTDPTRALSAMPGNMALLKSFEYQLRLKFKFAGGAGNNLIKMEDENGSETAGKPDEFSPASVFSALAGILATGHEELLGGSFAQAPSIPQALPYELADAEFEVRASGVLDRSAKEGDPDFSTQFDMSVTEKAGTIGLGAEFRSIGDTYYFRLVELPLPILSPVLSLTPFSALDITKYIKNWYSLKRDTIADLKLTASAGNIDEGRLDEQAEKLKDLMARSNLFSIKSVTRGEALQNSAVYHYELLPDKEGILNFMSGAVEIQGDRRLTKSEEESLNDFVSGLDNMEFEAWIDKDSRHLLKLNASMPNYDIGDMGLNAEATLDLSNFNIAKVPLPERSIPFDDELGKIFTESLDVARGKARDARRIADIRQLQIAMELYYDSNGNRYPAELKVLAPKFIQLIPSDPATNKPYFYAFHSSTQTYHLGATLEEQDNPALQLDKDCNSRTGAGCAYSRGYASPFDGGDSKGCDGETGMACFDVVP